MSFPSKRLLGAAAAALIVAATAGGCSKSNDNAGSPFAPPATATGQQQQPTQAQPEPVAPAPATDTATDAATDAPPPPPANGDFCAAYNEASSMVASSIVSNNLGDPAVVAKWDAVIAGSPTPQLAADLQAYRDAYANAADLTTWISNQPQPSAQGMEDLLAACPTVLEDAENLADDLAPDVESLTSEGIDELLAELDRAVKELENLTSQGQG